MGVHDSSDGSLGSELDEIGSHRIRRRVRVAPHVAPVNQRFFTVKTASTRDPFRSKVDKSIPVDSYG